jgi:RNA polymerase sporulation-specific sigma factor
VLLYLLQFVFAFSYVTTSNSFPTPLTAEEEKKYLQEFANGSVEAKNILIERNLRLVAHIVKKYSNYSKDADDLISIGTIGLIKGITSFDISKGTRLATYVARCIENEILMDMRTAKKQQNEVYLQDPIGTDKEGNEVTLIDIVSAENNDIDEQVDLKIQVIKLYEKMKSLLKGQEKVVIELRYGLANGKEKTQREIADMLGISRSYVSRIEKKALKKLSKEMKEE